MSHDLVSSAAEKLGSVEFSDDEFVSALLSFITDERGSEDFNRLVPEIIDAMSSVKPSVSMFGTYEETIIEKPVKEKIARQKRKKVDLGEKKEPESVQNIQKGESGSDKFNMINAQIQNVIYFSLI